MAGSPRADGLGVQGEGARPVVLGRVYAVVGRGVEDARGPEVREDRADTAGIEDVELPAREPDELAGTVEGPDEVEAELAGGADDDVARRAGRVRRRAGHLLWVAGSPRRGQRGGRAA